MIWLIDETANQAIKMSKLRLFSFGSELKLVAEMLLIILFTSKMRIATGHLTGKIATGHTRTIILRSTDFVCIYRADLAYKNDTPRW